MIFQKEFKIKLPRLFRDIGSEDIGIPGPEPIFYFKDLEPDYYRKQQYLSYLHNVHIEPIAAVDWIPPEIKE